MTRGKSTGRELGLFLVQPSPAPQLCGQTPGTRNRHIRHLLCAWHLYGARLQPERRKPTSNSSLARKHRRGYNSTDRKSMLPFHLLTPAIHDRKRCDTAKKINTLARCGISNPPPFLNNSSLHLLHFCNFLCLIFCSPKLIY